MNIDLSVAIRKAQGVTNPGPFYFSIIESGPQGLPRGGSFARIAGNSVPTRQRQSSKRTAGIVSLLILRALYGEPSMILLRSCCHLSPVGLLGPGETARTVENAPRDQLSAEKLDAEQADT